VAASAPAAGRGDRPPPFPVRISRLDFFSCRVVQVASYEHAYDLVRSPG